MSSDTAATSASDVTAVESCGRWPLIMLLGSAVKWLVVSSIFALIAGIQLHSPSFLSECPILSHGRVQALAETTFV